MTCWVALRPATRALDFEESAWVGALFSEGRALLDAGLGLFAYTDRVDASRRIQLGSVAGQQTACEFGQRSLRGAAKIKAALARIDRTGVGSLDDGTGSALRGGLALTPFRDRCEPHGVGDLFTMVGHDSAGFGAFLTVPLPRRPSAPSTTQRRALEHLAAELAAAVRLRQRRGTLQVARPSASERRVAARVLAGDSDKAIALELGVSLRPCRRPFAARAGSSAVDRARSCCSRRGALRSKTCSVASCCSSG